MASNKANADWWAETPKDLILHDQIWYNAIRVLVSVTGDKPQFSWSGHLGNIARKCTIY